MLLDPTKPVPFKPRDDGPTYHLRVPTVMDRAKYRKALAAAGARFWRNLELVRLGRTSIDKLLPGEDGDDGRALLDAYIERLQAALEARRTSPGKEADDELIAAVQIPEAVSTLLVAIAEHDPAMRKAAGDNASYYLLAGIEACRLFLVGADGLATFKRGLNGPTDETLMQITSGDLERIGFQVEEMLEPTEARLGNSASPSSGQPEATDSSDTGETTPQTAPSKGKTATA